MRTCIAPKRAIVDKRIKAAFEQKVLEKVASKSLANIRSFEHTGKCVEAFSTAVCKVEAELRKYGVDFGPLVHPKGRDDVAAQVQESQAQGARHRPVCI